MHHKCRRFQYFGIFVTFTGLIVVGTSSLLTPGQKCEYVSLFLQSAQNRSSARSSEASSKLVLGLLLIVAGQFCGALQMVKDSSYIADCAAL
jgi:hypothetical protein